MKTTTQTKKAAKAPKTVTETNPKAESPEPAPEATGRKTPRLSDALKAEADRIIARRDRKAAPKEREPEEDLVVFAFRLSPEERELIHKAAGPARASKFVRALAVAAACADRKAIDLLLESAKPATA